MRSRSMPVESVAVRMGLVLVEFVAFALARSDTWTHRNRVALRIFVAVAFG